MENFKHKPINPEDIEVHYFTVPTVIKTDVPTGAYGGVTMGTEMKGFVPVEEVSRIIRSAMFSAAQHVEVQHLEYPEEQEALIKKRYEEWLNTSNKFL